MYKITPTDYGLAVAIHGRLCKSDALKFIDDIHFKTKSITNKFGVIFDLQEIEPICEAVYPLMISVFSFLKGKGMQRSAVIYASHAQVEDVIDAANTAGLSKDQRYYSTLAFTTPEKVIEAWIKRGKDPMSLVLE